MKGFFQIWLIIVALVIILSSGAYYLGRSSVSKSLSLSASVITSRSTSSPTPDETTNWKTYVNREYGYVLKYPNNFKITDEIKNMPPVINNLYLDDNPNAVPGEYKIRALVGKDIQSEIKSLNYLDNRGNFRGSFEELGEIKINNLNITKGWIVDEPMGREYALLVPLSKDYSLTIRGKIGYEEIVDKIVSTFKLL